MGYEGKGKVRDHSRLRVKLIVGMENQRGRGIFREKVIEFFYSL